MQNNQQCNINEGLELGDLKRLVHPELHIDEFKSKIGDDKDMVVLSFKVNGKEPSQDLVNFLEKGYDCVVDADVSTGEMDDGDYLVFVEIPRDKEVHKNIETIMSDMMNVTEQKLKDWRVRYSRDNKETYFSIEALEELIPASPEEYEARYGSKELDEMRNAAGIAIPARAPNTEYIRSLKAAAGIL
jgi:hypothetical protein